LKPSFSNDLFEQVLQRKNLQTAWKQVRANNGAAGVDGMTIEQFPDWVKSGEWSLLVTKLAKRQLQPFSGASGGN
jgi:RNA-directed DNA polymerase